MNYIASELQTTRRVLHGCPPYETVLRCADEPDMVLSNLMRELTFLTSNEHETEIRKWG
jgi:hypothetical protein